PLWQAGTVRVERLHEVRVVGLEGLGDLVIVGRPGVDLIRVEIAHGVFDFSGVHGAARGRTAIRLCLGAGHDAARHAGYRVAHRGAHRRTRVRVEVTIDGLAAGL